MSQESNGKVIVIQPADASIKITDIVEQIISGILETGEINVVGINDSMFLVCSALNTATEIAKVYVDDIDIASLEAPVLASTSAIAAHLTQKQAWDYAKSSRTRRQRHARSCRTNNQR